MKKLWIATYVDRGETSDGKARVLDICKSKEEAEAVVRNDIEKWADDHAGEGIEVDFDKMSATYDYDTDDGCEWNIEEVSMNIQPECVKTTEKVLIDENANYKPTIVAVVQDYEKACCMANLS